ncbi:ABC-type dipeptide/oligopeptide/nickel transport systems permease component [Rubrobacter radiotolerans]|uniref:ABC transporter permease n=1 Tax=Rubrobacter radiotolerans TaxID=42256 RepID=A0A023X1L1_RUBRA|nr:ABC transporter permease [Rubrobacter radiotolerans]AHY46051.1 ABC-type dipeptide/oligopeptide/nickel transport systems permease component [Rubrobacter radiotolerans]MDX5893461.1 ABC transporter permease [Rubrobacter radiotolerans]SMC03778.1 oligopeptide transport system permease protein [Rubrobacter radiotolerans DSM 5868]
MVRYLVRRIVIMVIVLFIITTATWILMRLLPGTPFNDDRLTDQQLAIMQAKYGLDGPLWQQYLTYMGNLLQGDLGTSFSYGNRSATTILLERLPVSAFLGAQALVIGVVLGMIVGAVSALRQNTLWDRFGTVFILLGIAVPSFVLAPILQYVFGVRLGIFPIALFNSWWHSVLPSIVLGLGVAATIARFTRTEMLEVVNQDYVTLARSKGLGRVSVVWRHILRNSLIPLVTIIVPLAVALLTGTLIVEEIFAIPGLGQEFVRSVQTNDYTMIMATTILFSVFFVISYLVQDILYAIVDPRIRVAGTEE